MQTKKRISLIKTHIRYSDQSKIVLLCGFEFGNQSNLAVKKYYLYLYRSNNNISAYQNIQS